MSRLSLCYARHNAREVACVQYHELRVTDTSYRGYQFAVLSKGFTRK